MREDDDLGSVEEIKLKEKEQKKRIDDDKILSGEKKREKVLW